MSRHSISFFAILLPLALATPAGAQTPHDTGASVPLPVGDLPVGTVSVRITGPSMTDALADVAVVGTWTTTDGKRKTETVKTGKDGRALFENLPVGSTFTATAIAQGEALATQPFAIPDKGGTRFLMMVGAQAAANDSAGTAEGTPAGHPDVTGSTAQPTALRLGKVEARDGLKAGSVEIKVVDSAGKPLVGVNVDLGHANGKTVDLVHGTTDAAGVAHFAEMKADGSTAYAAVVTMDGMRIGTSAFVLEAKRGVAGEIKLPGRTDSLSVLRLGSASRMLVEPREEALGVLQNLVVENTSDKLFDPGPRGLFIPLPEGFTSAEKLPGGSEIEIKEGVGIYYHGTIPPGQSTGAAVQIRLGYVMTTRETRDFEVVQPMPLGLEGGLVLMPAEFTIGLSAPGLRTRPNERDDSGNELRIFELDSVPAGHALRLTVTGLPTHSPLGRWIAGLLASLILAAGIVTARRPRKTKASAAKAE